MRPLAIDGCDRLLYYEDINRDRVNPSNKITPRINR